MATDIFVSVIKGLYCRLGFNVGLKTTLKAFNVSFPPTSLMVLLKPFNVGWTLMSVEKRHLSPL